MYQPFHQPSQPPLSVNLLGKYADFLRLCYVEHDFTSMKWPYLDSKSYVNLAVINNEYSDREELMKFRQQTIHGSIDDILEWKAPIEMKDILKPNCIYNDQQREHYPVTQLLIEGAPGIGKSTFAWEVCQKWGQHQLFNEYSLVVLLKFRDKRVQEAKSVSDLFYHPNPKLLSEIVNVITTSGGNGVLIILEGFDEAPASKRTMDSIFVRLFIGQELPKATVILTTRPSASSELHELCKGKHSRRIEIVGFGKKEIIEYIQCAFSDEQSRSDFKVYLSLYPHIYSMMYVPLNSAIVIQLYKSCKSSSTVVPKTTTQLYSSLIRTLLLRYLKDKEEYKDTCTNINSFKDLPQPVYHQFCEICKMAYTGIMSAETELIFQDLPSDFDPLGLMQTCPELYVDRGASVSYNFLHLTVQEYLAAYHISQQSRDEQVAFMRKHIEANNLEKFMQKSIEVKKLEVVVRFLIGISELGKDLSDAVMEFGIETRSTYFSLREEKIIRLEVLRWLFESQNPSAISRILGSDCVSFNYGSYYATPLDWYVLGYCINHSCCDWSLDMRVLHRELQLFEMLLKALNLVQDQCQLQTTGKIKRMCLHSSSSTAVRWLLENVHHNLTHLALCHTFLDSEDCDFLATHCDLLQHLEYLYLSNNYYIGRGGTVNLIVSLITFSTIRELGLSMTSIGFEDCKALSELLASSRYLEMLDISENTLSPDSIQLIIDGLSHNTSLEKLDMSDAMFGSENVLHLASVLRGNTRLRELIIRRCNIQSSDSVHLAKALEESTQLQVLCVEDDPIGTEGAVAFAGMLATNRSLVDVNMGYCEIQGEGAVHLAMALKNNSTVCVFNVTHNPIGSEGAVAFADMLATNSSLAELDVSGYSIQEEGAVCLAKAMEHNSTLQCLDISYNPIGSKGALAFANMLKMNQCLKLLIVRDDSFDSVIGVDNALELIESLKHNTTLEKLWLSLEYEPPSFSTLDKALQDRVSFF